MAAVRAWLALLPLLAAALAGCGGEDDDAGGYSALTVRLHNAGASPLLVPVTVESEGRTVLAQAVRVPGSGHVDVPVPDLRAAPATLGVQYEHHEGGQHVDGSQRHVLKGDECPGAGVLVTFAFTFAQASGQQQFANRGSSGECQEA